MSDLQRRVDAIRAGTADVENHSTETGERERLCGGRRADDR